MATHRRTATYDSEVEARRSLDALFDCEPLLLPFEAWARAQDDLDLRARVEATGRAEDDDFLDGEPRQNLRDMSRSESEPVSLNDRLGLPRPMVMPQGAPQGPRRLPVPWINGAQGMQGDFFSFRADYPRALTERRCCICGEQLNRVVAIAAANGRRETSAGWGHPRCVHLAVSLCPHFQAERAQGWDVVAWLYEGPGIGVSDPCFYDMDDIDQPASPLGREELKTLARSNPDGH